VVAIAQGAGLAAQRGPAVGGAIRPSPSTGHRRQAPRFDVDRRARLFVFVCLFVLLDLEEARIPGSQETWQTR